MKSRLSKNAWSFGGGRRNKAIRDHSQCNLLTAKQALVEVDVLSEVPPAWQTIKLAAVNAGQRMERLLAKNNHLDPNRSDQQFTLGKIKEAVELLYNLAILANQDLQYQFGEYKEILATRRKKPNTPEKEQEGNQ